MSQQDLVMLTLIFLLQRVSAHLWPTQDTNTKNSLMKLVKQGNMTWVEYIVFQAMTTL